MRDRFTLPAIVWSCLFLGGCFEAKYESRLKVANDHFNHQTLLDANLGPQWSSNGMSFRLPKTFEAILPPASPQGEEKEGSVPALDPRQPDFLGMELPGLVGAWKASVTSQGQPASAYAYLLTNQSLLAMPAGPDRPNPAEFQNTTIEELSRAVKLTLKPEDWMMENFPKQAGFVPQIAYQSAMQESPREVAGKKMRYYLYKRDEGDVQLIVLFIIPSQTTDPIADKIPLSLETLVFQGSGGGGGGGGTSAPAGKGGGI